MLRYKLRTLLILLAVGPLLLAGTWWQAMASRLSKNSETIATVAEFKSLTTDGRVIVHFDVDWAIQAIQSRKPIAQLRERVMWNGVRVYRVDCTSQEGELWNYLLEWNKRNDLNKSIVYGGCGALVWIKNGQVKDSIENASALTVNELVTKTAQALTEE